MNHALEQIASAKSVHQCQPAQADMNRHFLLLVNFLQSERPYYPSIHLVVDPLPDMPILGSSNSAANKDMTSKI